MSNRPTSTGTSAAGRGAKSGPIASINGRTLFGVLRGARGWFAPLALLAMLTFLMQPALCWSWDGHGARSSETAAHSVSEVHAVSGGFVEPGGIVTNSPDQAPHDSAECCTTPDAATPQALPLQSALAWLSPSPALAMPTPARADLRSPVFRVFALGSWLRVRVLPYHARTARSLT